MPDNVVTQASPASRAHNPRPAAVELPAPTTARGTAPWLAPAGLVFLGLALRLLYINRETVGFDEAFSMTLVRSPVGEMMRRLVADFVHPPLHYFVLRGWLDIFGFGVFQARLLSAIFGTLAILVLYFFANYLFDRRTALGSALLLAVSQLGIMYSQEARPYAQLLFLALCSALLFTGALREQRVLYWWGFAVASILMIYTHYFGVFVVGALFLFAVLYRRRYRLRRAWVLAWAAVTLAVYAPWMISGILPAAIASPRTFSGKNSFWAVEWSTALGAINFFNNGKPTGLLESSPWWTFAAGGLLFCLPIALLLRLFLSKPGALGEQLQREGIMLVALLCALPLLSAIALGLFHFQYNVRYVAHCAAPYYILAAHGFSELKHRALRAALLVVLLAYTAHALRANYLLPRRENFRDALAYVARNSEPGDCGVFLPNYTVPLQWSITQGEAPPPFRVLSQDELAGGLQQCSRVWAISWSISGNPWSWARAESDRRPLEITHLKKEEQRYFWVRVGLYFRKPK